MKDNRGKSRGKRTRRKRAGDERLKNIKKETIQRLPEFTAEASLFRTTSGQHYRLASKYVQTSRPKIRSAQSFLNYFCYFKCMTECSIICSPPRMCLISCPQQCRAQCGLYGI